MLLLYYILYCFFLQRSVLVWFVYSQGRINIQLGMMLQQWRRVDYKLKVGPCYVDPSPFRSIPLRPFSSLPFTFPFPLFPVEVGPSNPPRGGERCSPPQAAVAGSGAEPQPTSNLVHFTFKMWHLGTTIIMIFPKLYQPQKSEPK